MDLSWVLKRPVITEKSMQQAAEKRYTFLVDKRATKGEIAKAVETFFEVTVLDVKTSKKIGKTKRYGRYRQAKRLSPTKKAVVRIKPDQKIELFELKEKK